MSHVAAPVGALSRVLSQASAWRLPFCWEGFDFSRREGWREIPPLEMTLGLARAPAALLCRWGQNKGGLSCATCRPLKGCLCWGPPAPPCWGGTIPPTATLLEEPSPANHTFLTLPAD